MLLPLTPYPLLPHPIPPLYTYRRSFCSTNLRRRTRCCAIPTGARSTTRWASRDWRRMAGRSYSGPKLLKKSGKSTRDSLRYITWASKLQISSALQTLGHFKKQTHPLVMIWRCTRRAEYLFQGKCYYNFCETKLKLFRDFYYNGIW